MKLSAFLLPVVLAFSSSVFASGWEYTKNLDAFTDEDRSYIGPTEANFMQSDGEVLLVTKCMSDGLNILLMHGYMIGDRDDEVRVELRVDKNPAYGPAYWPLLSGQEASFMPMSHIDTYLKELESGDSLVIRVTDPGDGEIKTGSFSLSGFSETVRKLGCY